VSSPPREKNLHELHLTALFVLQLAYGGGRRTLVPPSPTLLATPRRAKAAWLPPVFVARRRMSQHRRHRLQFPPCLLAALAIGPTLAQQRQPAFLAAAAGICSKGLAAVVAHSSGGCRRLQQSGRGSSEPLQHQQPPFVAATASVCSGEGRRL
jgi:hypothetical protein